MVVTKWDKVSLQIPPYQLTQRRVRENNALYNGRHGVLCQPLTDTTPRLRKSTRQVHTTNVQKMPFNSVGEAARWLRSDE